MNRREEILTMRDKGMTWQQIGDHYGFSRQRAYQLANGKKERAKYRMKRYIEYNRHRMHKNKQRKHRWKPCTYCDALATK